MSHLREESLVLLHYGESEDVADEHHLASCDVCKAELEALAADLHDLDVGPVPERDVDYGADVWRRVQPRLSSGRPSRSRVWIPLLAAGLLLATFLAGRLSTRWAPEPGNAEIRERILLVALGEHLNRSEVLLLEIGNTEGRALERGTAEDLVRQSRLYRQSAAGVLDVATTDVLDELERLLLDIAREARSGDQIKARIADQDVLFKIQVLRASVRYREEKLQVQKF